jgi:hypothetical protein
MDLGETIDKIILTITDILKICVACLLVFYGLLEVKFLLLCLSFYEVIDGNLSCKGFF